MFPKSLLLFFILNFCARKRSSTPNQIIIVHTGKDEIILVFKFCKVLVFEEKCVSHNELSIQIWNSKTRTNNVRCVYFVLHNSGQGVYYYTKAQKVCTQLCQGSLLLHNSSKCVQFYNNARCTATIFSKCVYYYTFVCTTKQ